MGVRVRSTLGKGTVGARDARGVRSRRAALVTRHRRRPPGRPRRRRRRGRGGGLVRSGAAGGRTVIHAGTTRTLVPVLSIHACGRFSLLDACGVCTVRGERAGGKSPRRLAGVRPCFCESIDRRVLHMREMQPTDLHTWSSTKAPPSTRAPPKPTPARRKRRQAQTARTASARSLPTSRAPSSGPQNPAKSTRAPPRTHRPSRDNDVSSRAKPREPRGPRARDDRAPPRPSRRGIRRPRGEERRRPAQVRAEFPIRPTLVAFPAPDRSTRDSSRPVRAAYLNE